MGEFKVLEEELIEVFFSNLAVALTHLNCLLITVCCLHKAAFDRGMYIAPAKGCNLAKDTWNLHAVVK